jgi:hypothetical protein
VCAAALLALPAASQAANVDYRAQLSEGISNGSPGVSPSLTLTAKIDNGTGGKTQIATGVLRFSIDREHLAPTAWAALTAARPGTQLGTLTSELTGSDASPIRVLGHGRDKIGRYVRAGVSVERSTAVAIGADTIPMYIRQTAKGSMLTFALDAHVAVGKLAANSEPSALHDVTLALRSGIVFGGKGYAITHNPAKLATLTNSLTAQACAQAACVTLRPATAPSTATVHLPKIVTVAAPKTAQYGYRYSIAGQARAGDQVRLLGLSDDGLVETRGSAAVRPDGKFLIRATLRSAFSDDGDLLLPARGRYGVASSEGGNATVYGLAAEDTHVTLAEPRIVMQRKPGGKLHFAVRVPGGDKHVRVSIKLGNETLAKGYATSSGRFFKTIVKPSSKGNLRAVVSIPGADTAVSAPITLSQ